ncbi:unnamed protein product [Rotaria socialis]|uniref:Roadblock/LAMTOR2 domain-containing protein n=1 Tax=Rotaria socialis TaxID=392032 RepID=A0A820EUV2_9BILA|nr:unnamed protein product [Rotaria socialis]CAF3405464.1 unnamed protein product [Rotaria socialis]CAF3440483.1 unnamed protein product [Rotaria socialis]CAF3487612.1 unnamed protein product [Rotaria socialis]CAF3701086.1 unnamed protein product [Rotaria socialis]
MALKEVQIMLDRVQTLEHVTGYICMTSSGMPIRTNFDEEYTKNLVTQLQPFLERIKRTINHIGLKEVVELRLKTKKLEYLLRADNICTFIVVQRHAEDKNGIDE